MQALTFLFAFVAVLALIGVALWLVRRFAGNRLGANTQRGRMPRLAVIDAAAVDGRRRLVLVRRDNVEHLLMIGGPTDIVVEPNIVRAVAGRDQLPYRPPGGAEPPPRITPLPDALGEHEDAFPHAEPQMPEPPPRPARPAFAEEMRRPAAPPMPVPERRADPLAGFAPEPMPSRPEPRVDARDARVEARLEPRPEPRSEPRPELPPRMPRGEPMMPRPTREAPKPPPMRAPERAIVPPPPPPAPPPPSPPVPSNADQNLAEMAQRLEAALRRPAAPATDAPPVAPEPPPARASRAEPPAAPAPAKTSFENLEDEMASLLGRPKSSSS
jgi:flagellar protein FliO/FliZ